MSYNLSGLAHMFNFLGSNNCLCLVLFKAATAKPIVISEGLIHGFLIFFLH